MQKHHWNMVEPQSVNIHRFLGSTYYTEINQVDALIERTTAIGGVPVAGLGMLPYIVWSLLG
ncbi:ferritin-like domain-containing protein [Halalkalirubrum salinum]|uniref:ferritin-like domain-containing protein n=1 Tax=Halalkalirubrum salinum TaxID=2563889 RepID=UPI0037423C17